jgi:hypothetical protein
MILHRFPTNSVIQIKKYILDRSASHYRGISLNRYTVHGSLGSSPSQIVVWLPFKGFISEGSSLSYPLNLLSVPALIVFNCSSSSSAVFFLRFLTSS